MKHYKLLSLVLFVIGVYSCEKESVHYPFTLSATSVEREVSFYTKNGEITSEQEIKKLLEQKPYVHSNNSDDEKIMGFIIPEITYLSASEAHLKFHDGDEDKNRLIYETDDLIYLENQFVTKYYPDGECIYDYGFVLYTLDSKKYKPLYYGVNNTSDDSEKACFYIKKMNNQLIVPVYTYVLETYAKAEDDDGALIWEWAGTRLTYPTYNEFDDKNISLMGDKDTLSVQQLYVKLE